MLFYALWLHSTLSGLHSTLSDQHFTLCGRHSMLCTTFCALRLTFYAPHYILCFLAWILRCLAFVHALSPTFYALYYIVRYLTLCSMLYGQDVMLCTPTFYAHWPAFCSLVDSGRHITTSQHNIASQHRITTQHYSTAQHSTAHHIIDHTASQFMSITQHIASYCIITCHTSYHIAWHHITTYHIITSHPKGQPCTTP